VVSLLDLADNQKFSLLLSKHLFSPANALTGICRGLLPNNFKITSFSSAKAYSGFCWGLLENHKFFIVK